MLERIGFRKSVGNYCSAGPGFRLPEPYCNQIWLLLVSAVLGFLSVGCQRTPAPIKPEFSVSYQKFFGNTVAQRSILVKLRNQNRLHSPDLTTSRPTPSKVVVTSTTSGSYDYHSEFSSSGKLVASSSIPELSAELVTTTSGWAVYHHRLFWTNDIGRSWKNITPPLNDDESVSSTFFLSPSAGWVTILQEDSVGKANVVIATTSDGGLTWQKSLVQAALRFLALPHIWAGTSHTFFLDEMNGWLELQRASSSNFQEGILLATKDGCKSWLQLPNPPTVDSMTWVSPQVGWIAGGVLKGDLYSTRDGGQSWSKQTSTVPSGTTDTPGQALVPRFTDAQHGMFMVTYRGLKVRPASSLVAVYKTADSGKTWLAVDSQEIPTLQYAAGVSLTGVPTWAYMAKGAIETTVLANTASAQLPPTSTLRSDGQQKPAMTTARSLAVMGSAFADANTGFLLVQEDTCDAANAHCSSAWRLLATRDAGRNVVDVTPPTSPNSLERASDGDTVHHKSVRRNL